MKKMYECFKNLYLPQAVGNFEKHLKRMETNTSEPISEPIFNPV